MSQVWRQLGRFVKCAEWEAAQPGDEEVLPTLLGKHIDAAQLAFYQELIHKISAETVARAVDNGDITADEALRLRGAQIKGTLSLRSHRSAHRSCEFVVRQDAWQSTLSAPRQ
jgi:hypothetical protein